MACAAPWPMNGYIGWHASPSKVVRPTDHRCNGSRSNRAQMKHVSAAAMIRLTWGCQPSNAASARRSSRDRSSPRGSTCRARSSRRSSAVARARRSSARSAAGTDPRLGADLEPEVGDALDRYQATIGDAAREARRLLAEQRGAHRGVDAVRADHQVDRDSAAVLEPGLDAVTLVGEADQAVAQMHALGRKGRRDDREQVGAVNGEMRSAVQLLAPRVQWRALERTAVLPAPLMRADRPDGVAVERLAEAEPVEDPHRVRSHVDAAADLGQYRRLLVDIDVEAGLTKHDGRRDAADPGADDGDPDYRV